VPEFITLDLCYKRLNVLITSPSLLGEVLGRGAYNRRCWGEAPTKRGVEERCWQHEVLKIGADNMKGWGEMLTTGGFWER